MEIKKKIDIIGPNVIDVGYRLFLLEEAERRKIIMLDMRNVRKKDKEKEILEILLGDDKEKVNEFVKWMMIPSNRPDEAQVDEDGIKEEDYLGDILTREEYHKTFAISQLSKIATSGVKLLQTQHKMLQTQNKMLETQNKMLETQNKTVEKQDKISDSIRETVDLQTDINSRISRFSSFGQQIISTEDEIKDKINKIGRDLKMYIDERIGHTDERIVHIDEKIGDINQRIDEMKIVKRQ